MKKDVVCVIIICFIFLTGCTKEKELVCTKDISSNGISIIQTNSIKFIGDKIDNMGSSVSIVLPDSYKVYSDTFVEKFKKQYETMYGKYQHVKLITKKQSDKKINISIVLDYKNMTKQEKIDLNLLESGKYSDNRKSLEKQGFNCK